MKCPHCKYNECTATQVGNKTHYHKGEYGDMFMFDTTGRDPMYRYRGDTFDQYIPLWACPKCGGAFIRPQEVIVL